MIGAVGCSRDLKTQGGVNDISGVDIKDGEGSFADQGLIAFLEVGGIRAARNGWRVVDTANRDADFLGGALQFVVAAGSGEARVVGHGDRVDRRDGLAYSQVLDVILINFKIPSDRAVGCPGVDAIATDGEGVAEIAQDGIEII